MLDLTLAFLGLALSAFFSGSELAFISTNPLQMEVWSKQNRRGSTTALKLLGNPDSLKINLDTGNSWLGGSDPVELAKVFKDDIYHIHWKDLPAEMESQRGTMWGTGMGLIPLGTGAIDIAGVYDALKDAPHVEYTTLEVAGDEAMLKSYEYLKSLGAE